MNDRLDVMGHGGMYDELGQVSTMLGTGHADQRHCGERIDRVRDELDALDQRLQGAVEALRELVRLKDGPRDDAYRAAKDAAWQAARDVLTGQSS